jgi:hypothetical protein
VARGGLVIVIEKVNQSPRGERGSVVTHGADPATAWAWIRLIADTTIVDPGYYIVGRELRGVVDNNDF